ncbi:MotA/TolQ/ExbB proton channel family protein [Opitutaceae bacterium TAV4]|uniref:MotA/TolQ/ExbB proton channel family protein n=1 Tax=Geminisphaera colitermitum TaxID=1148786 RepID=UPI000158D3C4|nr:MotA/TolQ/ExbB proton channel family protein [Geminisphaera colitermitum]RRJ95475.1 MotA/TolQ/ExbB proton channel family protein [Opitutaceae bacterium TAV4]RRJ99654.1 MotA/TolQ/ExbB proton channel family protein [Opitutaceae bacterium TAV3]
MFFAIIDIIKGADLLIYPLALCSLILVFILFERGFALRRAAVLPDDLVDAVVSGEPGGGGQDSVLARVIAFAGRHPNDPDAVKAFARLEVTRMERGLPYLDVIYTGAPLLGLTGTVWSLIRVFSSISGETGLPDPVKFTSGVSLALSATVLGLIIAIPALVGSGIYQRKVDKFAAQLDVLLERILAGQARAGSAGKSQIPSG